MSSSDAEAQDGTFSYRITMPELQYGILNVYPFDEGSDPVKILDIWYASENTGGSWTAQGSESLPAGYYRVSVQLSRKDGSSQKYARVTDITDVPGKTVKGTSIDLTGTVVPENATKRTIVWTVNDPGKAVNW